MRQRRRFSHPARWLWLAAVLLLCVTAVGSVLTVYLGNLAREDLQRQNEAAVAAVSLHIEAELQGLNRAVKALAENPSILPALVLPHQEALADVHRVLDRYNKAMASSVAYLMDETGLTVAATNRQAPDGFLGVNFAFRPYFQEAMRGDTGRYLAVGVTSGRRGYYAAHPVRDQTGRIRGVVAMEKDLDAIEFWLGKHAHCFLVSRDGVVFLSNQSDLLLRSLWPMTEEARRRLLVSRQFGNQIFAPVFAGEVRDRDRLSLDGMDLLAARRNLDLAGWSAVRLIPATRIFVYQLAGVLGTILLGVIVLGFCSILHQIDRRRMAARASEQELADIVSFLPDATVVVDRQGRVRHWNRAMEEMTGVPAAAMVGKGDHAYAVPFYGEARPMLIDYVLNPAEEMHRHYAALQVGEDSVSGETFVVRLRGSERFLLGKARVLRDNKGRLIGAIEAVRDITERKAMEEALRQSEERYRSILESMEEGYYEVDLRGVIRFGNRAGARILGYDVHEIVGLSFRAITDDSNAERMFRICNAVWKTGESTRSSDWELLHKEGRRVVVEASVSLVRNAEGAPAGFRGIIRDVTERREAERRIAHLAFHDGLTGLPNRALFNDRLAMAMAHAERKGETLAFLILDLDRFKEVNDALGHATGDLLLQAVAQRLQEALRKGDTLARFGGDEFVLLLTDFAPGDSLKEIVCRILDAFAAPFVVEGRALSITLSIGIAQFPGDGKDQDTLFRRADAALYRAKGAGRNSYRFAGAIE